MWGLPLVTLQRERSINVQSSILALMEKKSLGILPLRCSQLWTVAMLWAIMMFPSCASDNIHRPSPDAPDTEGKLLLNGVVTSSIPDFAFFEPVVADDRMEIEFTQGNTATVTLGEFTIYVSVMNHTITIGEMVVDGVTVTYDEDGTATLTKADFECQAGAYTTRGSLDGTYDPDRGTADITYDYKPGSMPFMVKSRFTGNL